MTYHINPQSAMITRRWYTRIAYSLIVAVLGLLPFAPGALAFQTRTPLGSFGPDGTSATSFEDPGSLSINQATDRFYYADYQHASPASAIHAFDIPAHTPVGGAFPLSVPKGSGNPQIAVDNTLGASAGNIYYNVGEQTFSKVFGYAAAGAPLGGNFPLEREGATWRGVAVDSAGHIWVAVGGGREEINKYDSSGKSLGAFMTPQGSPSALAFDSNDDLYVGFDSNRSIWKYTAASNYKTATKLSSSFGGGWLAIDRSKQILYFPTTGEGETEVVACDLAGNRLYGFGVPGRKVSGVAVDESADQIYLSSSDHKVHTFGALADFPDASATVSAATNVEGTKAELHATIDDNSALGTNWRFEVSKDGGATWKKETFQQSLENHTTAGGESGVPISATMGGLQSNTEYLFRIAVNKGPGSSDVFSNQLSFHTELIPPASVTPIPAENITAESAELRATIDDNGPLPTTWRFEVSKDNGVTWAKPEGNVSGQTAGGQSGVAVSGAAKGLEPNTEYRFRIVTKKDEGAPDEPSSSLSFATLAVAPVLSGVGAAAITDTSAYLAAEINPRNLQTSYRFEYGPTPSLGSSTPLTDIGSGNETLVISRQLTELNPDSDYYFKLIASNAAGTSESAVLKLHTRATPLPLPEDRAYEQVTPVDKNSANLPGTLRSAVAWDGDAVVFHMQTGIGDPPGQIGFLGTEYRSARGPDGWHTRWLGEPLCLTESEESVGNIEYLLLQGLSSNLDSAVIAHAEGGKCPLPPLDPAAPLPAENLYLASYDGGSPTYHLLTPQLSFVHFYGYPTGQFQAASEDFSHIVYDSSGQQTPDAPAGDFKKLFDWHAGTLSLLSKDTAGTPFATDSSVAESALNGVSADGSRVFFQNPLCGSTSNCELYTRQNDAVTYDISQSECTSSCGADAPDIFRWATSTGNKAFFTSAAKLTNDDSAASGEDLYLYTHSANPAVNKNLTLLSKDSEPADGTKAEVQGVLGMSDDAGTVFFVANGQLVPGAPTAVGAKVYRWRANGGSPTLDYLATLIGPGGSNGYGDSLNWASGVEGATFRPGARAVTPDGSDLLIHTFVRLDPAADHDADEDVYRWDAQGGWGCLSCQLPALPSQGDSTFQGPTLARFNSLSGAMSDDGQRVFFTSHDALVPQDTNNGVADVYEWHDGAVDLISSGTASRDAELLGASRSGDDVFFITAQRLVGWDTDGNTDIYDARVGGGFPEPPPTGALCEGEACRNTGTSASALPGAGTASFTGPGNPPPPSGCPKGKSRKHGRCVAKHHSKKHRHQRAAKRNRRAGR